MRKSDSTKNLKEEMGDYEDIYLFSSKHTYPNGFSKNQKRALRRKCQDKFKVKRGCLNHCNDGQVDWKEVPRDNAHIERILECCHLSLEGKCLGFSITKRLDH